ncbi:hypothetical protein P7K49_008165 [Saguinus oedipus]|uniref:Uncharacterized protein n=1 Tax=Saguinus oedipus TaxID=9490 RepID=A0ABQ9VWY6_SAGOE|nr:hypothetical protein P7K49_008165 [Saguinus oedipus]
MGLSKTRKAAAIMVRARRGRLDGGAGGRRHRHPRGAHAGTAGTGERGSARHARRSRPRAQPNGCAPRASRATRVIQGCGQRRGCDSAAGILSPPSPGAPAPVRAQPPGAAPPGTRRVGRSSAAAAAARAPRIVLRPPPTSASQKPGARGSGRGRGVPAAAAAARGGREWGAAAGARLMTSRPGCGSAGARTWLRRFRRRPRAAPGLESPAPSRGAARQSALSAGALAGRLSLPAHPGLPPKQPPLAKLLRSPRENREALAGASRRCYPHLPPPYAPPGGWGFEGCSRR